MSRIVPGFVIAPADGRSVFLILRVNVIREPYGIDVDPHDLGEIRGTIMEFAIPSMRSVIFHDLNILRMIITTDIILFDPDHTKDIIPC